jgi:hypothetical protein
VSGEAVAGSIIGFLRLDADSFFRTIEEAQAATDHLDGKDVNVRVKADTAGAETKLAAVAASEDKVDKGNVKVAKSGQQAGQGMGALVAALVLAGPAIVPLAAGAAGLAVGLGAMGAAGVLAVVGIMQEMKAGTTLGASYTGMLTTLKGDLTTLGHTAAAGVLQPFQVSVADLQKRMPALNSIIGEFSGITGRTAGVLTTGLVAAFIALEPLARDAGVYVLTLSTRFAALMSGPGVVSFGDYVRSVFPQVMQAVESIVGAALHLIAALAPLGLGTLGILRVFSDLISAMPVDVLATLATTAASVYLGFSAFKMLSAPLTAVGTALRFVGVSAESAAVGVRSLTIAAGVIGAIITVATFLYTAHAESVRQDQAAVNDLTDALRASNGALDENVRKVAYKSLVESGAADTAKRYGISMSDATSAALGQTDAQTRLNTQIDAARTKSEAALVTDGKYASSLLGTAKNLDGSTSAFAANTSAQGGATNASIAAGQKLTALSGAVTAYTGTLKTAEQVIKDEAAATNTAAAAGDAGAIAQQNLANKLGMTLPALIAAEDKQKKAAAATADATYKMYAENDAAGILKMGLDLLNGKAISAAQAQNAFDSSLVNMGDHVNATGKKITFTTTSIKDMSSASVALRGQLNGQVTNLQTVIEANGGLANSTGKARAQMVTMRQQIIDNAVAHGVNRAAVTAYIDRLLAIPKSVPPTKLDVDKAAAEAKLTAFDKAAVAATRNRAMAVRADVSQAVSALSGLQGYLDRLHSRGIVLTASQQNSANKLLGMHSANGNIFNANGSIIKAFAGGGFENHVAQIGNGITRTWNEPETGGEAYIPLAASKRARSTAIWEETGKRLGMGGSGGPVELGPNTIRALGREIAARPMMLDGAQVSRSVDSRLVPR